jgi:hypothetical protein
LRFAQNVIRSLLANKSWSTPLAASNASAKNMKNFSKKKKSRISTPARDTAANLADIGSGFKTPDQVQWPPQIAGFRIRAWLSRIEDIFWPYHILSDSFRGRLPQLQSAA